MIDEDYYARVEGREIISNLAKVCEMPVFILYDTQVVQTSANVRNNNPMFTFKQVIIESVKIGIQISSESVKIRLEHMNKLLEQEAFIDSMKVERAEFKEKRLFWFKVFLLVFVYQ